MVLLPEPPMTGAVVVGILAGLAGRGRRVRCGGRVDCSTTTTDNDGAAVVVAPSTTTIGTVVGVDVVIVITSCNCRWLIICRRNDVRR